MLFIFLMFLLFDKSGRVCLYSGVKGLRVCVDLGSLSAVSVEANCSLAQKMNHSTFMLSISPFSICCLISMNRHLLLIPVLFRSAHLDIVF